MADIDSIDFKKFITNATHDIFEKMLSLQVETVDLDAVQIQEANKIVGSVGFAGKVVGCLNIHVETALAKTITANMIGEDPGDMEDEEILDMVGELSNMIGGDVKSRLCDAGLPCSLSIPTTTSGTDFIIDSTGWIKHEQLALQSKDHSALVEVYVKSNN